MSDQPKVNKMQRKRISLDTKIQILDRLAKGEGSSSVGKSFNFNEATIRTIKKNESSIRQSVLSGSKLSSKTSSYSRNVALEQMEKALITWIEDNTKKRIPVDGHTIKLKALRIYEEIKRLTPGTSAQSANEKQTKFAASNGWLHCFLERHALYNVKIKGEIASGNTEAAREYPAELAKLIEEGGYNADQVFNADETGLFWKKMPSRTYIAKTEKSASGFKACKDRVTFLLCSNASGDKMLKPLVINKSLRPRAMKGIKLNTLPVHWMANKKAWVTSAIFTDWFHNCFIPDVRRYLKDKGISFKVLLLIDNAPGHPNLEHPDVKIVFLPPNTTSLIQPLDQGIIATFKTYYIRRSFQFILNKIDNDPYLTVIDAWKQYSILDCVNLSYLALSEIKSSTLNACWKALWPECVTNNVSQLEAPINDVNSEILTLAQTIGGEGFDNFGVDDITELIEDRALNEAELLEIALEEANSEVSSDEEEPPALTSTLILEGIQIANKLETHFLSNDPVDERGRKFQADLKSCMARYKELFKELSKTGSQRSISEFTVKIGQPQPSEILHESTSLHEEPTVQISSDESDVVQTTQPKRMRLVSESEPE